MSEELKVKCPCCGSTDFDIVGRSYECVPCGCCWDETKRRTPPDDAPQAARGVEPFGWSYELLSKCGEVVSHALRIGRTSDVFGVKGDSYSPTYSVRERPLYASPPAAPAGDARGGDFRYCDNAPHMHCQLDDCLANGCRQIRLGHATASAAELAQARELNTRLGYSYATPPPKDADEAVVRDALRKRDAEFCEAIVAQMNFEGYRMTLDVEQFLHYFNERYPKLPAFADALAAQSRAGKEEGR